MFKGALHVWVLWHKVVAINSWIAKYTHFKDKCHMCACGYLGRTIAPRFLGLLKRVWDVSISIVHSMKARPNQNEPLSGLHEIFAKNIPSSLSKHTRIWLLFRGIALCDYLESPHLQQHQTGCEQRSPKHLARSPWWCVHCVGQDISLRHTWNTKKNP
jgi:hypothetical protein